MKVMVRFAVKRGGIPVFTGRFLVVGCKLSGGGRGGRTGGEAPVDLGDAPDTGEYRFKLGGPWEVFFGGPWEAFHATGVRGGYSKSYRSFKKAEGDAVISSTREDVLLPLLSGLLAFLENVAGVWSPIASSD